MWNKITYLNSNVGDGARCDGLHSQDVGNMSAGRRLVFFRAFRRWGSILDVDLAINIQGRCGRCKNEFESLNLIRGMCSVCSEVLTFTRIALRIRFTPMFLRSPFACGYKNEGQESPVTKYSGSPLRIFWRTLQTLMGGCSWIE